MAKPRPKTLKPHPVICVLRAKRKEAGISIFKMSRILGYNYNTISRWEMGRLNPSMKSITDYASYFGLDLTLCGSSRQQTSTPTPSTPSTEPASTTA